MPELPEVETTLRGIEPHIKHQKIIHLVIRFPKLRWPIPKNLPNILKNQPINELSRRGKYILFEFPNGTAILHLGMSGSLRIVSKDDEPKKHDHIDIEFGNKKILRFTDPRRFGAFLWTESDPEKHELLKNLGPEPLSKEFNGNYLFSKAQKRKVPVKSFIMNSHIVVGVGNIYATEALFAAKIHPETPAGNISKEKFTALANEIKKILRFAIKKGGTTLKDFTHSDGKPGYFKLHLKAYGRKGLACENCKTELKEIRLGQRSTVFCPKCQPRK